MHKFGGGSDMARCVMGSVPRAALPVRVEAAKAGAEEKGH